MLLVESLLLFTSIVLFPDSFVYVDCSPLVSDAPPKFASGLDPLQSIIFTDHPFDYIERTIPGFFLPFGVNVIKFDDKFSYLFI